VCATGIPNGFAAASAASPLIQKWECTTSGRSVAHAVRKRRANVFTSDFDYDDSDPDGYRSGEKRAGGEALTVRVYELPPGQSVCPYHYEYEEEWLLVLEGAVVVRVPATIANLGSGFDAIGLRG